MKKTSIAVLMLALPLAGQAEDKTWSGEGELGYTANSSSSNTESTSLFAKLGIDYKRGKWGNQLGVERVRSESTDELGEESTTADRSLVTDTVTYDINDTWYALFNAKYEDDDLSSFHYQQNYTAGLGWRVINSETMKLNLEAGAGYQSLKLRATDTAPSERQTGESGRFFEDFSYQVSESADLTQSLLVEGNDENLQTTFDVGLRVAINTSLALKLSHQIKHNSEVAEGDDHYDRTTTASLVYGF